jgi:hypothetical protein
MTCQILRVNTQLAGQFLAKLKRLVLTHVAALRSPTRQLPLDYPNLDALHLADGYQEIGNASKAGSEGM